jgi:hypothetical protein
VRHVIGVIDSLFDISAWEAHVAAIGRLELINAN